MGNIFVADLPVLSAESAEIIWLAYTGGEYNISVSNPGFLIGRPFDIYLDLLSSDFLTISLLCLYLLVGLLHLLFYSRQPAEKYNLYFGVFSIAAGLQWSFNTTLRHLFFHHDILWR
jgi:hypothetical protein